MTRKAIKLRNAFRLVITGLLALLLHPDLPGQGKKKISLKDSADGKFDLGDYIIEANGFVPVPYIITEPSLGGFGGAIVPIFIKKRPPFRDFTHGRMQSSPVPPDITGGAVMYTLNGSWGLMAFRSGTFISSRIKYLAGGGYGKVNMSFYKTLPQLGEKELKFSIEAIPALLQATRRIGHSNWYAGLKYLFLKTKIKYTGDGILKAFTDSLDFDRLISQLGIIVELDNRDNVFTPDKGIKLHFDCIRSDDIFGSDYEFWRMNYYMYLYRPVIKEKLIAGLRIDGQQTFGDPPFYIKPFIDMRGIPANRYQGDADILSELEMRWNIRPRWSVMLFGGAGKAFEKWNDFEDADWVLSYGSGFRYLLARKFKLRVGVDIARGAGAWAYYIVFGSSWLK